MEKERVEILSGIILAGLLANPGVNPNARMIQQNYPPQALSIAQELVRVIDEEW